MTSGARYSGVPHNVYVSPAHALVVGQRARNRARTIAHLLRKAKIDQFQVTLGINEDVLGLQVSVGHAFVLVQELEDEDNLSSVELRGGLVEATGAAEVAEDFTAWAVVELSRAGQRLDPSGLKARSRTTM